MVHDSHRLSGPRHWVERLFFALLPPQRLAFSTSAWMEKALGDGWTLQRADRLHMTLAITDDFDDLPFGLLNGLRRVGGRVMAAPFDVNLDHLALSNRSAALRPSRTNTGLKALQGAIREAMTAEGVSMRRDWHFSPHMTLGYRDGRPAQRPVEARVWRAEEFVLIRSLVGKTRHLVLGRWPLRAEAVVQYQLL